MFPVYSRHRFILYLFFFLPRFSFRLVPQESVHGGVRLAVWLVGWLDMGTKTTARIGTSTSAQLSSRGGPGLEIRLRLGHGT